MSRIFPFLQDKQAEYRFINERIHEAVHGRKPQPKNNRKRTKGRRYKYIKVYKTVDLSGNNKHKFKTRKIWDNE